jgi:hypothetical protein
MGALYEFFRANKVSTADNYTRTNDREYQEDNGEKPLNQVVQNAKIQGKSQEPELQLPPL